jgi:hypothetical protein
VDTDAVDQGWTTSVIDLLPISPLTSILVSDKSYPNNEGGLDKILVDEPSTLWEAQPLNACTFSLKLKSPFPSTTLSFYINTKTNTMSSDAYISIDDLVDATSGCPATDAFFVLNDGL